MTTYAERLDNFERRLLTMQRELEELRHTMPVAEPELPAGPEPTREPTIWETLAPPPPPSPHPRPEPERAPRPLPVYEPAARAPLVPVPVAFQSGLSGIGTPPSCSPERSSSRSGATGAG